MVRPRYEVVRDGRTRIAHVNVERADLRPDPAIAAPAAGTRPRLPAAGAGAAARALPHADPADADGDDAGDAAGAARRVRARRPQGRASISSAACRATTRVAVDLDDVLPDGALADGGHAELVYDFRDGGEADGWLHTLVRAEHRASGHAAESSFGAHIFNTLMTWRDEPQSYAGPPPGLSTRLFLKLGSEGRRSFTVLIYPASAPWHPQSRTSLILHDGAGAPIAEAKFAIACSGSRRIFPDEHFSAAQMQAAGTRGYVLIRDATCRLFGYHGLMDARGGFSLDHMFGF